MDIAAVRGAARTAVSSRRSRAWGAQYARAVMAWLPAVGGAAGMGSRGPGHRLACARGQAGTPVRARLTGQDPPCRPTRGGPRHGAAQGESRRRDTTRRPAVKGPIRQGCDKPCCNTMGRRPWPRVVQTGWAQGLAAVPTKMARDVAKRATGSVARWCENRPLAGGDIEGRYSLCPGRNLACARSRAGEPVLARLPGWAPLRRPARRGPSRRAVHGGICQRVPWRRPTIKGPSRCSCTVPDNAVVSKWPGFRTGLQWWLEAITALNRDCKGSRVVCKRIHTRTGTCGPINVVGVM